MDNVGDVFQAETKYRRDKTVGSEMDWFNQPELYKQYPKSQKIELPGLGEVAGTSLLETLKARRSVRDYKNEPITKEALSYLLWASTGISHTQGDYAFRTAPSAGALYPIETYIAVNNVTQLAEGIYHYSIWSHELELVKRGNCGNALARSAMGQNICSDGAVVFVWTAIFQRAKWKYDQRGYRYVYLDAGHIAENLALAATSVNLGSCQIGALFDDEINDVLNLDGREESVIYMSAVGVPA